MYKENEMGRARAPKVREVTKNKRLVIIIAVEAARPRPVLSVGWQFWKLEF